MSPVHDEQIAAAYGASGSILCLGIALTLLDLQTSGIVIGGAIGLVGAVIQDYRRSR